MNFLCARTVAGGFCLSLWLAGAAFAADRVLLDLPAGVETNGIGLQDARVSIEGRALRVLTGHQQPWPGITLRAPGGSWDLSPYAQVTLKVKNAGSHPLTVNCRVDNPGADGIKNCVNGSLAIKPGESGLLKVDLSRSAGDRLKGKLFGMRGYPVGLGGEGGLNASNIIGMVVFVNKPAVDHVFEIQEVCAAGIYVPPTASTSDASPYFPFIDTFGQYKHKDWPGKTRSISDLATRRADESKELAQQRGPKDWDKYGGWAAGPQLKGTGFFRTEKHQGKWWLVDPEGRLFFSQGIDCVRMLDCTPTDEREAWFEDFPGNQPEFKEFAHKGWALHGYYSQRTVQCFSFAGANLARKYGAQWQRVYPSLIHQRLRSWGINTIANWSDDGIKLMHQTSYTDGIGSGGAKMIEGSEGYWGKFPDVFDSSFEDAVRRSMNSKKDRSAGDPWCIGYFCDNEMSWGDEISLAIAALRSPSEQAAKKAFLAELKLKYAEIARLNQTWGTAHASWEALQESREAPDSARAKEDLGAFYSKAAEQYFRIVHDAIKSVAPQQLYLGCRFAWVNDRAARAAVKYCDVVSYNLYQRSVADFQFNGAADVPLIIGEFHFGALDRGQFHTGLVPVTSQAARAAAYKDYVLGAARHPQFVGAHWFQWQDEPTTGRVYDEENYQIGFIDVADTPYAEIIAASRQVGEALYPSRSAK